MYIPTGNDDIFALDAKTGKKLWEYNSDIPQINDLICCGWDNRGVAVGDGKVFSGLLDGSFVALDQKTGKIAWRTQLEDYHDGYSITGATRYYDGIVFTGMSGAENGIRGRVYGARRQDGQEVWRFYTIPAPGDLGGDTWPRRTIRPTRPRPTRTAAPTVWQAPSIDPELGMLYFSTGNAGPDYDGSVRPGDNLFSASIVALDYKTGQYKWHFQEVHHDIWDFDAPSPTVLFDQMYNGQMRKGIYERGKTGWCYFLDRTNGQPLIGIDEKPVPAGAAQGDRRHAAVPGWRPVHRPVRATRCRSSRSRAASSRRSGTCRSLLAPTRRRRHRMEPERLQPADRASSTSTAPSRTARLAVAPAAVRAGQDATPGQSARRRSAHHQEHLHGARQSHQQDRLAEAREQRRRATAR